MNYIEKKLVNKNIDKEVLIIVERLAGESVAYNEPFYDYFDSLDSVECIIEIEKVFGIEIYDEDAEKITTVAECCALLRNKYVYSVVEQREEKLTKINGIN